jgi:hypothetical protein
MTRRRRGKRSESRETRKSAKSMLATSRAGAVDLWLGDRLAMVQHLRNPANGISRFTSPNLLRNRVIDSL